MPRYGFNSGVTWSEEISRWLFVWLTFFGAIAPTLPSLLNAARTMGFAGLKITYPRKQAIVPLLDGLSEPARAIGAVNTVVFREGQAIGDNTDGPGWSRAFKRALFN